LTFLIVTGLAEAWSNSENEDVAPNNPFLKQKPKDSVLEVAMQILPNLTPRKAASNFSNR